MELIGRVTANAIVTTLTNNSKVVNFTVAINDSYKPKGATERREVTTYVQCAYWINETIAAYLQKGTLVELSGRISVEAWLNRDGEPRATLRIHVDKIKFHGRSQRQAAATESKSGAEVPVSAEEETPF